MTERPAVPGVHASVRVHPTALLEDGVAVGPGSSIWDSVHIRHGARLGHDVIVGEKSYIAYDVVIGNWVKLNAMVYVCAEVSIGDGVMISAGATFTNDRFPRSMNRELTGLETSDVTEETMETRVHDGVTIGAGAVIGPGIALGRFAMVGMGSVVTRTVDPYTLVIGSPARPVAKVCACGPRLVDEATFQAAGESDRFSCSRCDREWANRDGVLSIVTDPWAREARIPLS